MVLASDQRFDKSDFREVLSINLQLADTG